ncbi:MAG: rRNA pseudouridine synthase [Proteobacteria bacterium]|nr:rRNA pseudouridine synthase [Pseudomonadota bacterium]
MRLQKLLAAAGLASRRGAEEFLRAGRVTVNGRTAALGDSADPTRDLVALDGERVEPEPVAYWLVNKPRGVVTTRRDPEGRRTVLDLLPAAQAHLYPVGRLDRDSEGLVLLTNDGATAHALLHPSLGSEREYRVRVRGLVSAATAARLQRGRLPLDDGPTAPVRIERVEPNAEREETVLIMTLFEGRKRQIRRMLQFVGHPVKRLARIRMGPLRLGKLAAGEARALTEGERQRLLTHATRALSAVRKGPAEAPEAAAKSARRSSRQVEE